MKPARFFKFLLILFLGIAASCMGTSTVFAAAPDGAGPWADSVVSSTQGLTKGGGSVPAARSDPTAAVGVAENDTVDSSFFSLGFGGTITLGFDNGVSNGVFVIEATNLGYPAEKANVELSADGTTWVLAGTVTQDGSVAQPEGMSCARYARITDVSVPGDFTDDTADAFDVDGVSATQGEPCEVPTPTPTPTPPAGGDCKPGENVVISGNGSGSSNAVTVKNKKTTLVAQSNAPFVASSLTSKAKTGKNSLLGNTGTDPASVVTGSAKSKNKVTVSGGTNITSIKSCCVCDSSCSPITNL